MAAKKTSPTPPPPAGTGGSSGSSGRQGYLIGRNTPGENKALSPSSLQRRLDAVAARARTVIGPGANGATEKALKAPLPREARAGTPMTTKPTASRPVKRGR